MFECHCHFLGGGLLIYLSVNLFVVILDIQIVLYLIFGIETAAAPSGSFRKAYTRSLRNSDSFLKKKSKVLFGKMSAQSFVTLENKFLLFSRVRWGAICR